MTRTLFIGLDGATFTILDELTSDPYGEGVTMPFLAGLIASGHKAPLRSTNHPLTPPAWVSLMTGRNPGSHGVFDFVRFKDMGHDVYFTLYDSRDIQDETIWSLAGRQGRRIVSLNFPMMAPPPEVEGCLVPGFTSWKHLRRNMRPEGLYDRIKAIDGFDPKELAWDFERESKIGEDMPEDEVEGWVRHHLPREAQWFRIADTLLEQENPDLFAVMFDGTDKIQHQAWHALDPALRPAAPSESWLRLRALCLGYFRELDGYIRRLVERAGPDAQIFLASDHGFTASPRVVRINRWLGEKGWLTWRTAGDSEAEKRRESANFAYLDWTKTLAYCPTPSSNGIAIRVARGPGEPGVPEADYESFRDTLVAELKEMRDPETGEKVIRDVLLRERAFPGAAMGDCPDLTLVLADYGFVSVRNVAPVVSMRATPTGTHHPDGIFIAAGPGIAPGASGRFSILDVPSILMHSLDLPVPRNFEGRVPDGLFAREVTIGPASRRMAAGTAAEPQVADEASEAEKLRILEQLKALGYLED
ncbi:MAG: alkaline phosphatase family protein [Alphaproteobacteria bacterium]|nr:alkaline phosphatase family protein [Alphaproteobacteria bacterium]